MRVRRIWTSAGAAVMVVGGVSLAVAPAASAVDQTIDADCLSSTDLSLAADPGDVMTLNLTNCTTFGWNGSGVARAWGAGWGPGGGLPFAPNSPGVWFEVTGGLTTLEWTAPEDTSPPVQIFGISSLNGGGGNFGSQFRVFISTGYTEPAPAADAPPIPAWVQAYGRASADATCIEGWDASWQSWAEPVTGGWVCTRSIPSLG